MNDVSTASSTIPVTSLSPGTTVPWNALLQLSRLANVDVASLRELIDHDGLKSVGTRADADVYSSKSLAILQRAAQLRADLPLDSQAFALAFMLSERILEVESELASLKRTYLFYVNPEALVA